MEKSVAFQDNIVILKPCCFCGRTFNPVSLERHKNVCGKNKNVNHRKVFDSSLQRTKHIDTMPVKPEKKQQNKKPNVKWKEQHEALLNTIRNDKNVTNNTYVMNNGCPSSKAVSSGYIQCPVCLRCFNYKAADRHISWCREQQCRLPKSPPSFEAMQRLKARVHYRAPLPGRKHSIPFEAPRLVKSAESCKSASVLRTYSSPCSLNRSSTSKQVTFQELLPVPRRHSCERSLFKKDTNQSYDKNFNSSSMKKTSSLHAIDTNPVKFKEKFPTYHRSRKSGPVTEQEFEHLLLQDSYVPGKNNGNYDILSALRQQLDELELNDRMLRTGNSGRSGKNDVPLPVVSSSELSPSFGIYDILSFEDNDFRQTSSSGSDGSLPSVRQEPSPLPRMPRFCYQCGTKYPITSAKYCCECGARRLIISNENAESAQS